MQRAKALSIPLPKSTIGGGSAMPLCGIVLPLSKNQRESASMLSLKEAPVARTPAASLILPGPPSILRVLNNNIY